MKYLALLVLLPTLVLAQPQGGQQAPSFSEYKKTMQPAIRENLPAMKQTRACLSKANAKSDVEACMKKMAEMTEAIQKKLGAPAGAGAPGGGGKGSAEMGKAPDDFKWDAETKESMLKSMDMRIQHDTAMIECLDQSNTGEEMNNCMRSKAPKK